MKKEQTKEVVLSEEQQYNILHKEIVQYGNMATTCFVQFMAKLKEMRDGKLYQAIGIETFGEYVESQVGIKERQAYNYISAYENYSPEFLQSNAKIGITKLLLLAPLEEGKREQLMNEMDVENTSVRELKQTIADRERQIAEQEQQIAEQAQEISDFDSMLEQKNAEVLSITAERDELEQKAKSLEAEKASWQKSVDDFKKLTEQLQKKEEEKQKLQNKIEELKNAPAKVETVDNPETVKALEAAQKQIEQLEAEKRAIKKQLEVANDETMSRFKSKFDDFQLIGQDILHLLSAMDDEKANKCRAALKTVVGGWQL